VENLAAQHGIVKPTGIVASDRVGGDLPEWTADTALSSSRDHRALMLQQYFATSQPRLTCPPHAISARGHCRRRFSQNGE